MHRPTLTVAIKLAGGTLIERRSEPDVAYYCAPNSEWFLAQIWSKQLSLDAFPLQSWNRTAEWQQDFDLRLMQQTGAQPLEG